MSRTWNVLFLCTGNSARSILAEAILNREGGDRFRAFSAGSFPKGQVHLAALGLLRELGYPVQGLRSKSWDEFAGEGVLEIDLIVTVCDNAAGEPCPIWPGRPLTAHWGVEDPADVEGEGQRAAFQAAYEALKHRIERLLALPLDGADAAALSGWLREIGQAQEAPSDA
ncbi:MAG: arsenate reductase ArsC [Sphingomonadaceae bacterium]|nr:arsenate reductase ArsC [Sphingomonadaceae bacterium]